MHHNFDVNVATKYGVNVAIFLSNMAFWIQKNIANNKHFYDGRYWTYNSVKAYSKIFPYLTSKQIRTTIDNCIKKKLILKGNYNDNRHDHTSWHCLTDLGLETVGISICPNGQNALPTGANRSDPEGNSLTDIKPDIKPDKKQSSRNKNKSKLSLQETHEKHGATRFSLKEFDYKNYNFDFSVEQLIKKYELNVSIVFSKFINHLQSKKKNSFTDFDVNAWFLREIEYKQNQKFKIQKKELRSTVKDYVPQKDQKKYSSKDTAKSHMKAIKKTLRGSAQKAT